jgi:hypothetical protein
VEHKKADETKIKYKLPIISKADNEKRLVTLLVEMYKTKVDDFTQNNQSTKLNGNPTDRYKN